MPYKATLFFNASKQGWDESWYINAAGLNAAMNVMLVGFLPNRRNLLGTGAYIEAIRVVDLATPGAALFQQLPAPLPPNPNIIRDNVTNAIQIRLSTNAPYYRRTMWLRGIPDSWVAYQVDGSVQPNPIMTQALDVMVAAMAPQNIGANVISVDQAVNPALVVNNMTFDLTTGFCEISTVVNHGLTVGQYVRINKIQGANLRTGPPGNLSPNGTWQVLVVPTASTFFIALNSIDYTNLPIYYAGGFVRARNTVQGGFNTAGLFPLFTAYDFVQYARKKTGRAFFVPAGRRRGVRKM